MPGGQESTMLLEGLCGRARMASTCDKEFLSSAARGSERIRKTDQIKKANNIRGSFTRSVKVKFSTSLGTTYLCRDSYSLILYNYNWLNPVDTKLSDKVACRCMTVIFYSWHVDHRMGHNDQY